MNIFTLSSFITALLSLILGVFVYLQNKRSATNRYWFFMSLAVACWSFGIALFFLPPATKELAYKWLIFHDIAAVFIPVFFTHFIFAFTGSTNEHRKYLSVLYALIISFIVITLFKPNLFAIDIAPKLNFKFYPIPGPLYYFFAIVWGYTVVYSLAFIIVKINKLTGYKKNNLKYVLSGACIGFSGGATTFLPVFNVNIPPFGMIFVSIYTVVISAAILKHRLMDINIVIKKSVIYAYASLAAFDPSFRFNYTFTANLF